MPAISTFTSGIHIASAEWVILNLVLGVSSKQAATALMLSKDSARAVRSSRNAGLAVLPTEETVGEAIGVLQAGNLALFYRQTLGGGLPFDFLDRFLQHVMITTTVRM